MSSKLPITFTRLNDISMQDGDTLEVGLFESALKDIKTGVFLRATDLGQTLCLVGIDDGKEIFNMEFSQILTTLGWERPKV